MKFKSIVFMSIALLYLSSCSDDDKSPTASLMLPMSQGNFWVYETFELTEGSFQSTGYDSTFISGSTSKLGENCFEFTTITGVDRGNLQSEPQITYYRADGAKIYMFSDFLSNQLGSNGGTGSLPIEVDEQWMLIANENDDFWRVFEQNISDPGGLGLSGKIEVFGEYSGKRELMIMGKNYTAKEFVSDVSVNLSANFNNLPINIVVETKLHNFFVDGIGIVYRVTDATTITLPFIGEQEVPATESILINYSIK